MPGVFWLAAVLIVFGAWLAGHIPVDSIAQIAFLFGLTIGILTRYLDEALERYRCRKLGKRAHRRWAPLIHELERVEETAAKLEALEAAELMLRANLIEEIGERLGR